MSQQDPHLPPLRGGPLLSREKRERKIDTGRILLLLLIVLAIAAFFVFDLGAYLTLASLKARQAELAAFVEANPLAAVAAFFLLYVAVDRPLAPRRGDPDPRGGGDLRAVGGDVDRLLRLDDRRQPRLPLLALSAPRLGEGAVRRADRARSTAASSEDGAFYLLTLRLIPAFPFFLINLAMGLTAMRLVTFALVSQIGMLPGTIVYVNAGTQLAAIESTGDILSPALIGSFVLLGLFPLLAKAAVGWWKRRRVYRGWRRPRRFDRNLIVIGAGAGGLVTALIGATVRAKVTLIEKGEMGGDCLNTGCVPSKALIRSARAAHEIRTAAAYGIAPAEPEVRFAELIERIHRIIAEIAPADSVERYTGARGRRPQGPCQARRSLDGGDRRRRAADRPRHRHRRRRRARRAADPGPGRKRLSHQRLRCGRSCAAATGCRSGSRSSAAARSAPRWPRPSPGSAPG